MHCDIHYNNFPAPPSRPWHDILSRAVHKNQPYGALNISHTEGSVVGVGGIVHYEHIASTKVTPVLREALLFIFEPRRFAASDYSKRVPRRVCDHLLKPC